AERLLRGLAGRDERLMENLAAVLGHRDIVVRQGAHALQRQHVLLRGERDPLVHADQLEVRPGGGVGRARERRERDQCRRDEEESLHRLAPAAAAAPNSVSGAWKRPSGNATPRFSNFWRNFGRRPVARRPPTIVPSRVTSSSWNLNSSCRVMTSDSIPCTSVTEVTRREPSSSRSRWMTH